jgi:hypothetical protein
VPEINEDLLQGLLTDVLGQDEIEAKKDEIEDTITGILKQYNLSTDLSFVEKMAKLKFHTNKGEEVDIENMPAELKDAAFLPVNTIADIALRQDMDMIISQLPEWFNAIQVTRDAVCESDIVTGKLSRTLQFDRVSFDDHEKESNISKIEEVEDRMELNHIIKNHIVFNTLLYGESYVYTVPYAKVFSDLYQFRMNDTNKRKDSSVANMFEVSSTMKGYGYGESAIEVSLNDTIIQEHAKQKKQSNHSVFTEQELMDINPMYHGHTYREDGTEDKKSQKEYDEEFENYLKDIGDNISYIEQDIALPVIEQSAHDLKAVYDVKYHNTRNETDVKAFFEEVVSGNEDAEPSTFDKHFARIKGCYIRILPATKLIPIRIDRTVIGYYYVSDQTRTEKSGERRNSGLSGYTLRTPSIGYDTFSPDQMFCEKLANKIINNFDLKFMRDNTALHEQIVAILQSHKFNEAMLRFVYIPAEHVCQFSVNKDGMGCGHSMMEPGLIAARMYMFLKLYTVLYQINNSQVRVYNVRMSGIDKNYRQFVQETIRKFAARRVTANDIFNYRSSMTKVSGGSELIMPLGAGGEAPINVSSIDAADSPISTDLLDQLKTEAINSTPVPALLLTNGAVSEIEFAKETELANTKFNSFVSGVKIELNHDMTKFYRKILKWETDIEPELLKDLQFTFHMSTSKQLNVTSEKISTFDAMWQLVMNTFLTKEERQEKDGEPGDTPVARALKKKMIQKYLPEIDVDDFEKMAEEARDEANKHKLSEVDPNKNLLDNSVPDAAPGMDTGSEEGMMF